MRGAFPFKAATAEFWRQPSKKVGDPREGILVPTSFFLTLSILPKRFRKRVQFEYDANGNLVRKVEAGIETRYSYDALDRLLSTASNGITTTYTYDAFNRRISKNDLLFIYAGQNEIGSFRNGRIEELRVLGIGLGAEIGAAVLHELNGKTYIPIHEHNGNVAALFDQNGASVETYRYTGFGIETTPTSVINPWRYASKRFDPETGFIYFGRRYYAPAIGRWVTTDPEGYQDGPNLYAYVHNNPLSKYDLYGLFEEAGWFTSFDDFKSLAWDAKTTLFNSLSSPYFQGSLQAIGGFCEASLGCGVAITSSGLGAPL